MNYQMDYNVSGYQKFFVDVRESTTNFDDIPILL